MTNVKKIKYIIRCAIISIVGLYVYIILDSIVVNFPENIELQNEVLAIEQHLAQNTGANVVKQYNPIITSDILLTIIPPKVAETIVLRYGVEYCNSLSFLLVSDPEDIDWIRILFKNLTEPDILRLISIINSMNDRQVKELIDLLLQYSSVDISNILKIFINLDDNNLIYLLRDLDRQLLRGLLEMLLDNKLYEILLIYDKYELKRLMDRIKDDYWILKLMFELKTDLHDVLSIIEVIPNEHLQKLLWLFLQLNKHEKNEFVRLMNTMNTKHIISALNMVYFDRNLVDSSKKYFLTLKKYLGLEETTHIIEKSINIASKVDQTTRQRGVDKLHELRSVRTRRVIKQVDGNQFSGAIIKGMVDDSYSITPNDFENYSNILSGSIGFVHGPYRRSDRVVSQDRKIEVITKLYSGNVEDRQPNFDFMNGKVRSLVPHQIENDYVTQDPEPVILINN